jgi:hypothetical protein
MTSLSENPVAKKRGRPAGSKNKRVRTVAGKEYAFKDKAFKRRGRPRLTELPLGASSWQDAYNKTFKNLERAYERLVEFHDVHTKLEQAENDIVGMATIINYLELKLEEAKQKANDERTSI